MPEVSVEECIQICRTAAFENEVSEALGILDRFIRECEKRKDILSLSKLVQTFEEHKTDMDSKIYLAGTKKAATRKYPCNLYGMNEMAMDEIREIEDKRVLDELCKISDGRRG